MKFLLNCLLIILLLCGCKSNSTQVSNTITNKPVQSPVQLILDDSIHVNLATWDHSLKNYFETLRQSEKLVSVILTKNKTYPTFTLTSVGTEYPAASLDTQNEHALFNVFKTISQQNGYWDYTLVTDKHSWEVHNDKIKHAVLYVNTANQLDFNYNGLPCIPSNFPADEKAILSYLTKKLLSDETKYKLRFTDEYFKDYACQHLFNMALVDQKTTANSFLIYDSFNGNLYNENDNLEKSPLGTEDMFVYYFGLLSDDELAYTTSVIPGEYTLLNNNPIYSGKAIISTKGRNNYHISAKVLNGIGTNTGQFDSDFNVQNGQAVLLDSDTKGVSLRFNDNKIILDYPEVHRYGMEKAEPKATYYLNKSDNEATPFIKKLYSAAEIGSPYQNGFTSMQVIATEKNKQLIRVISQSSVNRSKDLPAQIGVYDESSQEFQFLGEENIETDADLIMEKKLLGMGFTQKNIYEAIKKEYKDRYLEVYVEHINKNGKEGSTVQLTDEEAFYIARGIKNTTYNENNQRNKENIGSIFKQEVDISTPTKVGIRFYEEVRNDEEDQHQATDLHLTVNRITGKVINDMFEASS